MRDDHVPQEEIDALLLRERASGALAEPAQPFEVWAQNWPVVQLFLACQSQWRMAVGLSGMVWLGLDYPGVDVVMRRRRMTRTNSAFEALQAMEFAALRVLQRQRPKSDE